MVNIGNSINIIKKQLTNINSKIYAHMYIEIINLKESVRNLLLSIINKK